MIDPFNAKGLETMSQQLLNMSRETAKTKVGFIKRIAKYVDWKIHKETDFSRITENNNDR